MHQRRSVAPEMGDDSITQPFHDWVLRPQIVQLRPGIFVGSGLPSGFDLLGDARRVGAERVVVVVGLHLARQLPQAVLQVAGCGDGYDLIRIAGPPLAQRLPLVQLGERCFCVVKIILEQRGWGFDVVEAAVGRRRLGGGLLGGAAAEELHQEVAFVVFQVGGRQIHGRLDLLWRQAVGHEEADFLGFLVRVVDVEEGGRVAEV